MRRAKKQALTVLDGGILMLTKMGGGALLTEKKGHFFCERTAAERLGGKEDAQIQKQGKRKKVNRQEE